MANIIIKNGLVFNQDGTFTKRDVFIHDDIIVNSCNLNKNITYTEINANNNYVIPGFIDTHIHGAVGHDFCDNNIEGLKNIAKYLRSIGVTSFCPTSMTLEKDLLKEIFKTANIDLNDLNKENKEYSNKEYSNIVGIHMEGPFLSSEKKGAQNAKYLSSPQIKIFEELNSACNNIIKIITLAPEYESSLDFIKEINKNYKDISISIGHTTADYELAIKSIEYGANRATHLYNAMQPFSHREPAVVGACFDNPNCFVELISDGIHVHPSMIRATFKLFQDRVVLVSDAMMAMGMPNGNYELGKQEVIVKDKKALLKDGTIAGSATDLISCVKKAIEFGINFGDAIKAGTVTPAKSIGIYDKVGSIDIGKNADILIVDQDLNIKKII